MVSLGYMRPMPLTSSLLSVGEVLVPLGHHRNTGHICKGAAPPLEDDGYWFSLLNEGHIKTQMHFVLWYMLWSPSLCLYT